MLAVAGLTGCMLTSDLVGVKEPDLSRIKIAAQRSQVEKVLGKRLWSAGSANGQIYDIYEFYRARPQRLGWAVADLGADYFTAGTLELIAADAKKFWPVKQVAVAYDDQDRVRFVSRPWRVESTTPPCRRMRCLLPADSGVPVNARPIPESRRGGPTADSAAVKWSSGVRVAVDGHLLEGSEAKLPPGFHEIRYREWSGIFGGGGALSG